MLLGSVMTRLKIGLVHQGWPAGSYITTRGLQRAFLRRDDVALVVRVPATRMEELPDELDFAFLEGYPRRAGWRQFQRLGCQKFFWWLSTWFGKLDAKRLAKTRFDHVFGNSPDGVEELAKLKPCTFLPLAFDRAMAEGATQVAEYGCEVTYLGVAGHKTRRQHKLILDPACRYDFALWGKGWGKTRYRTHHRGILPAGDIPKLYASANLVLGMTEHRQAAMGMINNRVFEALGCGAMFLADHFPALEALCGDYMTYSNSADDTHAAIERARTHPAEARERANAAQAWVLANHTYDQRAAHIIAVYRGEAPES